MRPASRPPPGPIATEAVQVRLQLSAGKMIARVCFLSPDKVSRVMIYPRAKPQETRDVFAQGVLCCSPPAPPRAAWTTFATRLEEQTQIWSY
jgi:hypothetical protein